MSIVTMKKCDRCGRIRPDRSPMKSDAYAAAATTGSVTILLPKDVVDFRTRPGYSRREGNSSPTPLEYLRKRALLRWADADAMLVERDR